MSKGTHFSRQVSSMISFRLVGSAGTPRCPSPNMPGGILLKSGLWDPDKGAKAFCEQSPVLMSISHRPGVVARNAASRKLMIFAFEGALSCVWWDESTGEAQNLVPAGLAAMLLQLSISCKSKRCCLPMPPSRPSGFAMCCRSFRAQQILIQNAQN